MLVPDKITYDQFQDLSVRTLINKDIEFNLLHMGIGLFSEYHEFLDSTDKVNLSEEIADMQWYISNYCSLRGIKFSSLELDSYVDYPTRGLDYDISEFQDLVKKYAVYNKEMDLEKEMEILLRIQGQLIIETELNDICMYQSLSNNIKKLYVRFPNAYTDYDANYRNLEEERKVLE